MASMSVPPLKRLNPSGPSSSRLAPPPMSTAPSSPRRKMQDVVEGEITFVGQGNPDPAKYYLVPRTYPVAEFAETFVFNKDIPQPQVLISVTGGAQDFKMLSSNLEQIFNRGLLRAAQNTSAWIITGGLSTGVMEFVGNAISQMDLQVPCIGVATFSKVSHNENLLNGGKLNYSAEKKNDAKSASLQHNHSHFILVQSEVDDWGQEIEFRTNLEHYFSITKKVPLVLVALNGGPNTIKTLVEGARQRFPIIIVDQSGRACDAMAAYIRNRVDEKRFKADAWHDLLKTLKPQQQAEYSAQMNELYEYRNRITIFNPSENAAEDMDKAILRCIMRFTEGTTFAQKMQLGVQWDRPDIIDDLLRQDVDSNVTTMQKTDAINYSLHQALKLNRPEIYELLVKKGADKDSIRLVELYTLPDVMYHIDRLRPYAGLLSKRNRAPSVAAASESSPLLVSSRGSGDQSMANFTSETWDIARKVFHSMNPIYEKLLDDKVVTFTDALVWSIVVDRPEMARAIWRNMEYPIHAALLACHLYSVLVEWFQGEEIYQQCRDWFENEAIAVLSEAEYDNAIPILRWKWPELNDYNALQLAELGECKEFTSHPFVQRYLNQKLYADVKGSISPGTPMWRILTHVVCPFLIPLTGTYTYGEVRPPVAPGVEFIGTPTENTPVHKTKFYHFYNLPMVKIISCTATYIFFLVLLTVNVMACTPERYDIDWFEVFLWIWVFGSLIEEVVQYLEDRAAYFDALSNQMDTFMNVGFIAYFILRLLAWQYRSDALAEAYTDVLILTNIICYARLMNVFAVSKSLGPLFFVIIRLFRDVMQWSFIFIVFALSFQIGIFALTRQSHNDPWERYPDGTLGVGFSTIIGEQGYNTMDYMEDTSIGVVLISVYAVISQVMLVNLLIAMMGDTYSTVKANSDKEWKFYRYDLITEFISTSPYPPPFNLLFGPIYFVKQHFWPKKVKVEKQHPNTIIHMKLARDKAIEKERVASRDSLESLSLFIRESTRLSISQNEGDRLTLEYNMKSLQASLDQNVAQQKQMVQMFEAMQTAFQAMQQKMGSQQDSLNGQERSLERLHQKLDTLSSRSSSSS